MKLFITSLLFLSTLFVAGASFRDDCDLAKVTKGRYCSYDKLAFDKSEVLNGIVYWYCADCDAGRANEGPCSYCKKPTTRKDAGKDVCPKCYRSTIDCDVCVKEYFACPKCGKGAAAAGSCGQCKVALVAKKSRALVKYTCSDCGKTSNNAGKCTDPDCSSKGKDLKRVCAESGKFPHTSGK